MHLAARNLTYLQFPSQWKWDQKGRKWEERKQQHGKIGRLHYVHPSAGERYYLRASPAILPKTHPYFSI
jgi:hypothetical protein